jgi:hypothetical protein
VKHVIQDVLLPEDDPINYLHELENPKPERSNNLEEKKESATFEPQE